MNKVFAFELFMILIGLIFGIFGLIMAIKGYQWANACRLTKKQFIEYKNNTVIEKI